MSVVLPSCKLRLTSPRHLLLAYESSIRVYSRATSLLLRTLYMSSKGSVTALAASLKNPNQLYVSLRNGRIEQWDWLAGQRLGQWNVKSRLYQLKVTDIDSVTSTAETVFTVDRINHQWKIIARRLRTAAAAGETEPQILFTSKERIECFEILGNGLYVVAVAGKRLIVGTKKDIKKDSSTLRLSYSWRELLCSDSISCLNSRLAKRTSQRSLGNGSAASLDVVVGSAAGPMYLYRDIAHQLNQVKRGELSMPVTSRLHWHRNGVGAVKWSADGESGSMYSASASNQYRKLFDIWWLGDCSGTVAARYRPPASLASSFGPHRKYRHLADRLFVRYSSRR